jgi:hypothetical protein
MAGRIRSLKPEVLDDETNASLSDGAWRLWISMWMLADDHGGVRAAERYLAANVWQDTTREVGPILEELIAKGRVEAYSVGGQRYVRVTDWAKHQRIDNAGKPRVPTPDEDDGTWNQELGRVFAESRGEAPRNAEGLDGSPLRAHACARIPAARISDHDLRSRSSITEPAASSPRPLALFASNDEPASKPKRSKAGTRITPDWKPDDETVTSFEAQGVDARACLPEFVDHWLGVPGAKGLKADWDATFRNRVRRLVDDGRAPMLRREQEPPLPPPVPIEPGAPERASAIHRTLREGLARPLAERAAR